MVVLQACAAAVAIAPSLATGYRYGPSRRRVTASAGRLYVINWRTLRTITIDIAPTDTSYVLGVALTSASLQHDLTRGCFMFRRKLPLLMNELCTALQVTLEYGWASCTSYKCRLHQPGLNAAHILAKSVQTLDFVRISEKQARNVLFVVCDARPLSDRRRHECLSPGIINTGNDTTRSRPRIVICT